jgi:hypothetical protein
MSSVKAIAVVGFAFLLFAPPVQADTASACSDAYSSAQELRTKRKLLGAREALRICSQATCPSFIVKDCTTWLDEVQASLPSVVPVATDAAGNDLAGVRVSMDGAVLFESSDGRSVDVDPGKHSFTFEFNGPQTEEAPAVVKHVVVAEGEKNKRISAVLRKAGAAQVAVAPPPPPVQQMQVQPVRPQAPVVPVTVQSAQEGTRLQFDSFETNAHASCVAPCTVQIPAGNYQVGTARGDGPVRYSHPLYVGGPGTVTANQVSHTGLHVGGILLLIGSVLVQIGMSVDAVSKNNVCDAYGNCTSSTDSAELEAATAIGILGFTAGMIMIEQKNHNDVTFVPLGVGSLRAPTLVGGGMREGAWVGASSAPHGGALQITF